jgi:hypothetical protein
LNPEGVIAFHVTNRFLRLAPVVEQLAQAHGLRAELVSDETDDGELSRTDWVLVSRSRALLDNRLIAQAATAIEPIPGQRPWTDDYNNLFRILK